MGDLSDIRNEIDAVDKEFMKLFEKRMELALKAAEYKKQNNIPILNKAREDEVIKKNVGRLQNKRFAKAGEEFLNNVISISRSLQARELFRVKKESINEEDKSSRSVEYKGEAISPKKKEVQVVFQGVPGSFSEEALVEYFGEKVKTCCVEEFEDVFKALNEDEIDYGVLPIENSSTGGIVEVYDLLRKYDVYIVGERTIKANQNLIGIKGASKEDIKEVYSHPQGLKQSSEFLSKYAHWKQVPYKNTAVSVELIKNENCKEKAAIGSRRAAEIYGLDIIEPNIHFNENNDTRFIVIGKKLESQQNYNKISILLTLPHKVGSLYNILRIFKENHLNMVKIESRPLLGKSFEYFFYIDFEGNLNDEVTKEAITEIRNNSYDFKLIGNYKSHSVNEQ